MASSKLNMIFLVFLLGWIFLSGCGHMPISKREERKNTTTQSLFIKADDKVICSFKRHFDVPGMVDEDHTEKVRITFRDDSLLAAGMKYHLPYNGINAHYDFISVWHFEGEISGDLKGTIKVLKYFKGYAVKLKMHLIFLDRNKAQRVLRGKRIFRTLID